MRMEIDEVGGWLRERLPGLAEEHGVPGAAVAVDAGGRVVEAAAGVLSTATGVEATVDSVFQIGSITKVLTATLVMQHVAEGLVELDAPVATYLPGFRDATVRQLLSHTAGFEVRGEPFDRCMRDHLFTPLHMTHASNDPYEAILHRAAVGHLGGRPAPVWAMARSNAPAGSMLAMTPRDLLAFARAHLADEGLRAMREPQVDLPGIGWGTAWGPYRTELLGLRGDSLLPAEPGHGPVAFPGDDGEGRARYLHTGRADVRAAGRA
ncbi:serine hydrolase domain-containing protein [Spirillospora sp. NPDC052242]